MCAGSCRLQESAKSANHCYNCSYMSGISLREVWYRVRRPFRHLTIGGDWAQVLPVDDRHNLRWLWFDGMFASASDNIYLTYLSVYLLALGATQAQIGLYSTFSNLSAALLLLPGAVLVERIGQRKEITLLGGGWVGRIALLMMALVPLALGGHALVWAAIALSVTRDAFGNLAYPAWTSLVGSIVPMEGRGRYFGSRNFIMGVGGMLTTLLIGALITRLGQPLGYQAAFVLAFIIGMGATYSFWRLKDPQGGKPIAGPTPLALGALWREMRGQRAFLVLCASGALWNFFLNVAGPFFTIYLVQDLHASASMVGLTSVAGSLFTLAVQHRAGTLSDRWGARRLQAVSMLCIPVLPFLWMLAGAAWHIILVNAVSGILWGAFALASFNYLLELAPPEQRARYAAIYQVVVTLSFAAGAAVGSLVVTQWGYLAVFAVSGVGRLLAALLFARFAKGDRASGLS